MFVFESDTKGPVTAEIELGKAKFTLTIERPSLAQRLDDEAFGERLIRLQKSPDYSEAYKARFWARVSLISDWSGVVDRKGKPIPYSIETLGQICSKFPDLIDRLYLALHDVYQADEVAVGELDARPVDSPEASGTTETK